MNEKKLTDEEIVKALEHCATENTCRGCVKHNGGTTIDYFKCMRDTKKNVVELIHRLKNENESLKKQIDELPKPRKKILANKVYSDSTLKKWSKEDLIEHIRILEHNWSCAEENLNNSVKNSEKIFYEQKVEIELLSKVIGSSKRKTKILELQKEIERLTEEKWQVQDDLDNYHEMNRELEKRNAELQKQVDELKEERENMQAVIFGLEEDKRLLQKQVDELKTENTELYKEHTTVIAGSILQKKQAVKDTAKEIYELIDAVKEVFPNDYRGYDMAHGWSMCVDKLKEIIKSKGAEVE